MSRVLKRVLKRDKSSNRDNHERTQLVSAKMSYTITLIIEWQNLKKKKEKKRYIC